MTTLNAPNIITTTDTSVGVSVGNTVTFSDLINNYGYIPIDIPVHPDELSQLIRADNTTGEVTVDFSTIKEAVGNFVHTITGPSSEFATTVTSFVNSLSLGTMVDPPFVTFNFPEQAVMSVPLDDVSSNVASYINLITYTINSDADYYGNTAGHLMLLQLDEQNASSKLIQVDSTYSQVVFNQCDQMQIANNIQFSHSVDIVPPFTGGSNMFLLPGQSRLTVQGPSVSGTFIANYVAGQRTDMDITVSDPISNVLQPTVYSTHGNLFAQIRRDVSMDAIPDPLTLVRADLTQSYSVTNYNILNRTNISAGTYYISSFGTVNVNRYPDSLLVTGSGASLIGVELLYKADILDKIANEFTPSLDLVNTYILLTNPSGSHYGEPVGDVYLTDGTYWVVKRKKMITVSDQTTEVLYTDATIFNDLGGTSTTFLYELPTDKMIQFDADTSNIYDALDETSTYNIDLKTKNISLLYNAESIPVVLNYQTYQSSDVFNISSLPVPYSVTDSYSNILTASNTFYDFKHDETYVVGT